MDRCKAWAPPGRVSVMCRVGQNHILHAVHIRYFWQGNHQNYGHIWCIFTVLANPSHVPIVMNLCRKLSITDQARGIVRRTPSTPVCLKLLLFLITKGSYNLIFIGAHTRLPIDHTTTAGPLPDTCPVFLVAA